MVEEKKRQRKIDFGKGRIGDPVKITNPDGSESTLTRDEYRATLPSASKRLSNEQEFAALKNPNVQRQKGLQESTAAQSQKLSAAEQQLNQEAEQKRLQEALLVPGVEKAKENIDNRVANAKLAPSDKFAQILPQFSPAPPNPKLRNKIIPDTIPFLQNGEIAQAEQQPYFDYSGRAILPGTPEYDEVRKITARDWEKGAAQARDYVSTAITGNKPLEIEKIEAIMEKELSELDKNVGMMESVPGLDDSVINQIVKTEVLIAEMESWQKSIGAQRLRYWIDEGAELENTIDYYKDRIAVQREKTANVIARQQFGAIQ